MKTPVSVVKCTNYDFPGVKAAVGKSIALVGGINSFIKRGDVVLVKVNALGAFRPKDAVTTNPAIVKAVLQLVKGARGRPVVGDLAGVFGDNSTMEVLEKCGILEVCRTEGVDAIGFETTGFRKVKIDGKMVKEIFAPTPLLDADKVISLPKLKTHTESILTGAVKNSFGFTPCKIRRIAHIENFKKFGGYVADFYSIRKPDLIVMDAIVGMEGNGPARGDKKNLGLVLASNDGVAVDSVASEIICIGDVPSIRIAGERGLGEAGLCNIEVLGEKIENVKGSFRAPITVSSKFPRFVRYLFISVLSSKLVVDENKCSKCMACIEYCPPNAISLRGFPRINENKCIECYGCKVLCVENAILVKKNPLKSALQGIRKIIRL